MFSIISHPFWGTPNFWKHPYALNNCCFFFHSSLGSTQTGGSSVAMECGIICFKDSGIISHLVFFFGETSGKLLSPVSGVQNGSKWCFWQWPRFSLGTWHRSVHFRIPQAPGCTKFLVGSPSATLVAASSTVMASLSVSRGLFSGIAARPDVFNMWESCRNPWKVLYNRGPQTLSSMIYMQAVKTTSASFFRKTGAPK